MLELLQVETSLIFAVVTYFVVLLCNKGAKESFSRNTSLFYVSLAVIIALGAVKLFYDSSYGLPMNYYSVMEVERHQNVLDIRRSYKTLGRRYHPDKNSGPDAELAFTNVKLAYDVLIDENLRDIYNRFGPRNLEFDPRKDEIKLMIDIATGFFFWGLFSYVVTLPTSWRGARSWIALLALVLLGAEVVFAMSGTEIPAFLHPTLTEYELIFYLNSAFPIVIVLLGASAQYFYMDMDATSISVLNDVVAHQKAMSEMMGKVEQILDLAKNPPSAASNQEAADCKDKIAELRDKLDEKSSAIAEKIKMLKSSTTSLGGDYHWVVLVLVYGLIFYVGSS